MNKNNKSKMGSDPFDTTGSLPWLKNTQKDNIGNVDNSSNLFHTSKQENESNTVLQNNNKNSDSQILPSNLDNKEEKDIQVGWRRATFIIRNDQLEKLKAHAYWERLQLKEVLEEAIDEYFKEKNVKEWKKKNRELK